MNFMKKKMFDESLKVPAPEIIVLTKNCTSFLFLDT